MNSFSKFYLLSPESYNKLVLDKMVHQGIDREMYNVLSMKKISDAKKWYLYRDLLFRFANKARNNKTVKDKPLNAIEPVMQDKKNRSPLKYSVQSQTNIVRRPRIHQINQTENEQNEMAVQTDPIMDETVYQLNPEDSFYDADSSNHGWPYEKSLPGFASFEIEKETSPKTATASSTARKSFNSSPKSASSSKNNSFNEEFTSPTAGDVAKTILNKSKRSTLRRALTYSGEKLNQTKLNQTKLNFPILKIPPYQTRAVSKKQIVQTGKNRFKWACMK